MGVVAGGVSQFEAGAAAIGIARPTAVVVVTNFVDGIFIGVFQRNQVGVM